MKPPGGETKRLSVTKRDSTRSAMARTMGNPLTRSNFINFLEEERTVRQVCATFPLTLLLWVFYVIVVWVHGNVDSNYRLRTCVYEAISEIEIPYTTLGSTIVGTRTLATLSDTSELWAWLAFGLVPALDRSYAVGQAPVVRTFNRVVGSHVMLRQRRVEPSKCKVSDEMAVYYGLDCFQTDGKTSSKPFGIIAYSAQDPAFLDGSGLADAGVAGITLSDIAGHFFGFLDVAHPTSRGLAPARGQQRAMDLFQGGWIDDSTSSVEAHVALFNAEVGAFTHVVVTFDYQGGGRFRVTLHVNPLPATAFYSFINIVVDVVWLALMMGLLFSVGQQIFDKTGGGCLKGRTNFWLILDIAIVLLGIALVGFYLLFSQRLELLGNELTDIPMFGPEQLDSLLLVRAHYAKVALLIQNLGWCLTVKMYHRLGLFWYIVILTMRFFRAFRGQQKLSTVGKSMGAAAMDLLHLLFIIVVVFFNFVVGGCVMFGSELESWSSFPNALRRTIDAFFGRVNFEEMHTVMPLASILWFFFFVLIVVFILRNLVIAIIIFYQMEIEDKYGGIESQGLLRQLVSLASDYWWWMSYVCRVIYSFLRRFAPKRLRRCLPKLPDEPARVRKVPFDILFANLGAPGYDHVEDLDMMLRARPGYETVDLAFLNASFCDDATGQRLLNKCIQWSSIREPDNYPPEKLTVEFEGAMHEAARNIMAFETELSEWMHEKQVDANNVEDRQKKLAQISAELRPILRTPRSDRSEHHEEEGSARLALDGGGRNHEALPDGQVDPDAEEQSALAVWPDAVAEASKRRK